MRNIFELKEQPGEEVAPKEVYGYRPYLLAFSGAWASAMYGYDSAFIGGTLALPSFKESYGLAHVPADQSAALSSNIVSTFQGGAFFGGAFGYFLAERFGRKPILMATAIVFSVGVILQMIGMIGLLYAGRVLTGLGVGSSAMILPIYIAECAPPMIRGRLVGIFEIMLQIALVFGFWVNYGVNKNLAPTPTQWRIPVGVQFIPAVFLLISMPFMIESPRWLVLTGRNKQALKAISWIRHLPEDHSYVVHELSKIEAGVLHELESATTTKAFSVPRELFSKGVRNRLLLGTGLMVFQNFTGINAINYYSPTIFTSIGFTGTSVGLLATGVYGLVKMFATLIYAVLIVDRFGRRLPLLVGAVGAGIAMFYLAIYSKVSNSIKVVPPPSAGSNAAVAMIYIYAIFYGASWNGIPWLFTAEVLPTRVRTMGMAVGTCTQWLSQFVVVYSLPYMINGIGYGTFLFFACCTVVAFIFAFLFVPETKGVGMEDMDLLFGPDVSVFALKARKNYDIHSVERREEILGDADKKKLEGQVLEHEMV